LTIHAETIADETSGSSGAYFLMVDLAAA